MQSSIFDRIYLEEALWAQVINNQLLLVINKIIAKIEAFYTHCILGGQGNTIIVRPIQGENAYKLRLSNGTRLPFKICEEEQKLCLTLGQILSHDEGILIHSLEYDFNPDREYQINPRTLSRDIQTTPYKFDHIARIWQLQDEERILNHAQADIRRALNKAQQDFLDKPGPILLKGTAGSGKTLSTGQKL
ncbi:MAG: hypothetical protein N5P05_001991 [Chroococcopsis gigantea SAG 12.99]|jgi:hypothetical protein|nr:hypothetical protein [Chroococcopsis gigantea SAG 12.99]